MKTMEMPRRQTPLQLALFAVLTEIHGDTCDTYSPRHHGEKAPELRHTTGSLGAWPELQTAGSEFKRTTLLFWDTDTFKCPRGQVPMCVSPDGATRRPEEVLLGVCLGGCLWMRLMLNAED